MSGREREQYKERGQEGDYSEGFLTLINKSDYLNPREKNALLEFGIESPELAMTLYEASFYAA